MSEAPPKLGATDRVLSRLTVLDWPLSPDGELAESIVNLTTLEPANDAPAVVEGSGSRHLVWRGYLTGGLLTLYEGLAPALREHDLSAFFADVRLEVWAPPTGDVVVLGALRHPVPLPRDEWDELVRKTDDVEDLVAHFARSLSFGAEEVIAEARAAQEARRGRIAAGRGPQRRCAALIPLAGPDR